VTDPVTSPGVLTFTVPGEPVAKQRPRVTRRGTFTPRKTLEAEARIGWSYREAARSSGQASARPSGPASVPADLDGQARYSVSMVFRCAGPRKDIDNLVKTVLDGLNGVAWLDDGQVSILHAERLEGGPPHTTVRIYRCEAVSD
jgi:Holliday junction resolvase RusA-like endonuclease